MQARILHIDDDEFMSKIYHQRFTNEGFFIEGASTGAQGITMAESGYYDIILLDMVLADMTGPDILLRLGEKGILKKTKAIVLSALSQEAEIAKARECGASDYAVKDRISPAEVVGKVKNLLSNSEAVPPQS